MSDRPNLPLTAGRLHGARTATAAIGTTATRSGPRVVLVLPDRTAGRFGEQVEPRPARSLRQAEYPDLVQAKAASPAAPKFLRVRKALATATVIVAAMLGMLLAHTLIGPVRTPEQAAGPDDTDMADRTTFEAGGEAPQWQPAPIDPLVLPPGAGDSAATVPQTQWTPPPSLGPSETSAVPTEASMMPTEPIIDQPGDLQVAPPAMQPSQEPAATGDERTAFDPGPDPHTRLEQRIITTR